MMKNTAGTVNLSTDEEEIKRRPFSFMQGREKLTL